MVVVIDVAVKGLAEESIGCGFRRFTRWQCKLCHAKQYKTSFLTVSGSREITIQAAQLQHRRRDAVEWLGYRAVLEQFWVPGDQVFPPPTCRDPVNRMHADAYLSSTEHQAHRWRVYHNDQLVLTMTLLPQQAAIMQPVDLTSDGWSRARRAEDFLNWLYKHRKPGRPPLEADPDGYWREAVRRGEALKQKYPSLTWEQIAARIEVHYEQFRKWRRRVRHMEDRP